MMTRPRRTKELAVALACYGIMGLVLAYGMWVAGSPLTPAVRAEAPAVCITGAECAGAVVAEMR